MWARIARNSLRLPAMRVPLRRMARRYLPNESQHLFTLTVVLGVVCGLVAVAFHLSIGAVESLLIDRALHAPGSSWMVWTVVSPTIGGLLAGAALTWIVPGARGSGIPQVKQAFAMEGGRVRFRDAFGKFIIGAVQIGSGASLGREGPTVQICAGAASLLARATSLPPRNMRRLTPVGAAAGIAAAFNAPISAVTFTIEEIVGALDHTVLSGVVVAAALAAVIERAILGGQPVIKVEQTYSLEHPSSLAFYAVLGVAAAFASVAFSDGLLKLRAWFRKLTVIPSWTHPAVGGAVTGLLAVVMLRVFGTAGVTGGGYRTLGRALAGELGLRVLLVLCVVKLIATVFSYSSGGAGGIFAPALFVGAMLGGAVGYLDVGLLHHESRQLGAFAVVGMGAVFAGVIRAPITSVLIIFEMTGGYGLVLPLMLANMTSYALARQWRPLPIYDALLAQDGVVLPHAASPTHVLEQLRVSDAMTTDVIKVGSNQCVSEALTLASGRTFASLPVVDSMGAVRGVVSLTELRNKSLDASSPVSILMRGSQFIRADAPLLRAVVRMNDLGIRQLVVVDGDSESKLVGILAMSDLVRAHARAAPSQALRTRGFPPPRSPLELRTGPLIARAIVVPGAARFAELTEHFRDGHTSVLLVRHGERHFGAIFREDLYEFERDEELHQMVVAADLARPVAVVDENADVAALAGVMTETGFDAAVSLGKDGEPLGVVTKTNLALALLDWSATHLSPLSNSGRPSGPDETAR